MIECVNCGEQQTKSRILCFWTQEDGKHLLRRADNLAIVAEVRTFGRGAGKEFRAYVGGEAQGKWFCQSNAKIECERAVNAEVADFVGSEV